MLRLLRSHKRVTRLVLSLVVCGLTVSLVGVYALNSLPGSVGNGEPGSEGATVPAAGREDEVQRLLGTIRELESAVRAQPQDAPRWLALANTRYDLGAVYFELQDQPAAKESFARALQAYRSYLKLAPDNVDARVNLGLAAFYLGQMDVARAAFVKALELAPEDAAAHLNYGIFLMEADKNYGTAIEHWQEVLRLDPHGPFAQQANQLISVARQNQK